MAGEGDPELDDEHAYSQDPEKLTRNVTTINGGNESSLNLFETIKLTYSSDNSIGRRQVPEFQGFLRRHQG
jgi:hypothetical protein